MRSPFLNSFQKWAAAYATPYGFAVEPHANWVCVTRDGISTEIMSVAGLKTHCDR